MNKADTAKLAKEIAAQSNPIKDWTTVDELKIVCYEIPNPKPESKPLKLDFGKCVDLYKQLDKEIEERQTVQKQLKEAIQAGQMLSGEKKIKAGDYVCQMIEKAGTRKIVAEKLLANGVSPEVIAKSTEEGKGSTYLQIRAAGDK